MAENTQKISAFVHVAYGFSADAWNAKWKSGALIGVNEPFAYGYQRAEKYGCRVLYSVDHPEGRVERALRYALRLILGFDLLHAFRNRRGMLSSDIVWTHTESQSLAVAAILRLDRRGTSPKTILQSVWLMDHWNRLSFFHRWMYENLLRSADVLTFHSSKNLEIARSVFRHNRRIEQVLFGIDADTLAPPRDAAAARPIRVLSVGNDVHRDWSTLKNALSDNPAFEFKIVTTRLPDTYLTGNGQVTRVANNEDLFSLYRWADICVVPVKANSHASGITAVEEATVRGVPVVCTDTGGLTDYFSRDEVTYAPVGDSIALREAIEGLATETDRRVAMVNRAQARMRDGGLSSDSFAKRHAELSRELVG